MRPYIQTSALCVLFVACGGDGPPDPGMQPVPSAPAEFIEHADGALEVRVDASDEMTWVHLDLDKATVTPAPADWDIAISRFNVRLNGGVSGEGGVEILALPATKVEDVTRAPAGIYMTDESKQGRDPLKPDYVPEADADLAFERPHATSETGWYVYDLAAHVLAPADVLYVLRSTDGAYYVIQWLDYYDEFGTPGYPKFKLRSIPGPSDNVSIDAQATTLLRLSDQSVVEAPEPSLEWDLWVSRSAMRTNSGASGPGLAGARWADEAVAYESITYAPTVGYATDALLPIPGPPGSGEAPANPVLAGWYDYDPATHQLSPKSGVLLVRGAKGDYAKLQIQSYDDGMYEWRLQPLPARPQTREQTITLGQGLSYLAFDTGEVVTSSVGPPASWDIAFGQDRVRVRGGAQAYEGDFDSLQEAALAGFVEEENSGGEPLHTSLSQWLSSGSPSSQWQISRSSGEGFVKVLLRREGSDALTVNYVFSGVHRTSYH